VAVDESTRAAETTGGRPGEHSQFVGARLESLRAFFSLLDASLAAFTQGKPLSAEEFKNVIPLATARQQGRK